MKKNVFKYALLLSFTALCSILHPSEEAVTDKGAGSSRGFTLPYFEKFTLANDLTVYLMEQHEVPLVYISVVFPAGAVKDEGKYGLASLTADALLFGTRNYTKAQIEESLDYLGVSYKTSASLEAASISMSFVNSDQSEVLPLLKEIMTDPSFDESEFDKRKKRLLLELEQEKERPSRVIGSYFNRFVYEDNAYGNPVTGTGESISDLTVDDVKHFYNSNYVPEESAIAIVGDIKIPEMRKTIQKTFSKWLVKSQPKAASSSSIPSHQKSRLLLVNKEDATETRFMIGSFGIRRGNPDYVAVQVINTILGGRFTSWLNDELRINAGLTYGAYSFFDSYKNSGVFALNSFTGTETTVEAIDLALEVLRRLHEEGIDEETLASAKKYLKGQFPPRYETAGSLASLLTSMFVYDFNESYINDFQKNVDGMTVEKAGEIIEKYFPEDNLQFVLIGKASEIRGLVKKYGEVTEEEITADGFFSDL